MTSTKNGIYYEFVNNNSNNNLVFIHGSGCNHKFLKSLAAKLPDFNCYLPDLPDHGKSKCINCQTAEDYVDAMADFMSDLENVTIVGHSLGGTICLGVAARAIPSVKKCVIISSGAKFDKLDARILTMVETKNVNWGYLLECLGSWQDPAVLADYLNFESTDIILKDFAIDCQLDFSDTLDQIQIPTLIMVGLDDILTLPEYSRIMRKNISNSRLVYFPRCRHMLPIARRKDVSQLIRKFVITGI